MSKLQTESLSTDELSKRIFNVSIKSKKHLRDWLEQSGRRWLLFDGLDLIDSLRFPEGVDDLMRVVAAYRDHRCSKFSGRTERQVEPTLGKTVEVPINKTELLEVEEMDRAIRFLIRQCSERFPSWRLENPPL